VTGPADCYLVLTPPSQRAIAEKLPEAVAVAVIDFLTTTLVANPHRAGKPLRDDLEGVWSARRGTYRVLYRINDNLHEVVVLRVEHRRDVYRPL
jgi:mRNA-degrading endonuclease RelE of RelBE toxin-antitoxin system